MSNEDKFENAKDKVVGKTKEVAGDATDDKKMKAEGKAQNLAGKAKEKLEDAKDTVEGVFEKAKDKLNDK